MESETKNVSLIYRTFCKKCNKVFLVPTEFLSAEAPLVILCPNNHELIIREWKSAVQKGEPIHRSNVNKDSVCRFGGERIPRSEEIEQKNASGSISSYRKLASRLSSSLANTFACAENLQQETEQIVNLISRDLQIIWNTTSFTKDVWNTKKLFQYLCNPVISIPIASRRDSCSMLVLPQFCEAKFGIPVFRNESYHVQYLDPVFRLAFPLDAGTCRMLSVAETPMLQVAGNKIVGRDLIYHVEDMPGVHEDTDHTKEVPSVVINDFSARVYLATHGVPPYDLSPLPSNSYSREYLRYGGQAAADACRIFFQQPRIAIFSKQDFREEIFSVLASCLKKPYYIFSNVDYVTGEDSSILKTWDKFSAYLDLPNSRSMACIADFTGLSLDEQVQATSLIKSLPVAKPLIVFVDDYMLDFDENGIIHQNIAGAVNRIYIHYPDNWFSQSQLPGYVDKKTARSLLKTLGRLHGKSDL